MDGRRSGPIVWHPASYQRSARTTRKVRLRRSCCSRSRRGRECCHHSWVGGSISSRSPWASSRLKGLPGGGRGGTGGAGPWPQAEITGCAEAEGGDRRSGIEFGLVVGVPAHGIAAVAIAIEQQGVEAPAGELLERQAQLSGGRRPGLDHIAQPAVAVAAAGIGHPAGEPRQRMAAAEKRDRLLLPGHLGLQRRQQLGRPGRGQPGRPVAQPQARALQFSHRLPPAGPRATVPPARAGRQRGRPTAAGGHAGGSPHPRAGPDH